MLVPMANSRKKDPVFGPHDFMLINPEFDKIFKKHGVDHSNEVCLHQVERQDDYVYEIDVPGAEKNTLNLEIEDGNLLLSFSRYTEAASYTKSKVWTLPKNTDYDNIFAHLDNGILRIRVPKIKKSRKIEIAG